MTLQTTIAILITITAIASYINHRFIKLPNSIGLTLVALIASLTLIAIDLLGLDLGKYAQTFIRSIDFNNTFVGGMLSFLLFAGALHLDVVELAKSKWLISVLATIGVIISTLLIGGFIYYLSYLLGINMRLIDCLVFGALISPTDPIAVLDCLKRANVRSSLAFNIAGESLFNDGIGIVAFVILTSIAHGDVSPEKHQIIIMVLQQLFGGIGLGLVLGYLTYWLLRNVNDYEVSVLITLALTTGGYLLATKLNTSGPIAMAIAGLFVGSKLTSCRLSKKTIEELHRFWDLIDKVLTAILFVLIGMVILQVDFSHDGIILAVLAIPVVLLARLISVKVPLSLFSIFQKFSKFTTLVLTWGGLRGGISIALALSLPNDGHKLEILVMTYTVVVFSILVQGLTINPMIKKSLG